MLEGEAAIEGWYPLRGEEVERVHWWQAVVEYWIGEDVKEYSGFGLISLLSSMVFFSRSYHFHFLRDFLVSWDGRCDVMAVWCGTSCMYILFDLANIKSLGFA